MSKQFWGVIIAVFIVFGGIFALSNKSDSKTTNTSAVSNNVIGEGKANVTIVEYGDFQCPYCGQYFPIVQQVKEKYKDQIFFQFRNFPLVNVHQNAFAASRAAEAAALQNKFWEMHDILYQNQTEWSSASSPMTYFQQYAKSIGLKEAQFKTDYASSKVNDTINADVAAGTKLDVTGTPTFFVNGKKTEIGGSVDAFSKVIDAAIAKSAKTSTKTPSTTATPAATTDETTTQTKASN